MKTLGRDDILNASDIRKEKVKVWGGEVWVRGMTGAERDKFEASVIQFKGNAQNLNLTNIRAKLCSLTVCDEEGNRLFTEADVQALSEKSAVELSKIFIVAQRLSGITDADVEELAEGLKENPFEDSASA